MRAPTCNPIFVTTCDALGFSRATVLIINPSSVGVKERHLFFSFLFGITDSECRTLCTAFLERFTRSAISLSLKSNFRKANITDLSSSDNRHPRPLLFVLWLPVNETLVLKYFFLRFSLLCGV